MLGVVYGLQVRLSPFPPQSLADSRRLPGHHLHPQARVHAHRLDGRLHRLLSDLLILPSRVLVLVHGRVLVG